nr:transglutaminase domain-containing protein [uncultured Flavobacterium sp.]
MNFFKSFITCLIVLIHINVYSQELELGKVTITELQEKRHPKDTTAAAAILFKRGKVDFEFSQDQGFTMFTEVTTRIKVYKKEGYEWANKKIDYYTVSNSKEMVYFSDAVTYNLVNGKIEKTKLKSDGVFEEKVNKYWSSKKITMPNVSEGSIIEYTYRVKSPRIAELTDWAFQASIPVNYSEFKTFVPEYFVYNTNMKGTLMPIRTVSKSRKSVNYTYRQEFDPGRGGGSSSQEKLDFEETLTAYIAKDLPALKEESFVNNINNYISSVSHELSSIRYPNQPYKNFSTNWESVAKAIYEDEDFGSELNKTGYFEDQIKALIAPLNSPEEKIAAIFAYVKSNVKWNGFRGYYCEQGVRTAFKNRSGNAGDINLMLTAMLRFAGLEANPVLVSTRDNGIALFPSRTAFDYVIAAIESPNGLVLLDATEANSMPNVLPTRDLNWFGRLIRKDGSSSEVDLMPKVLSNDVITMSYSVDSTGKISGKLQRQQSNYNAMLYRNRVKEENQDTYLEKLENENGKIEIEEYKRSNEKELHLPVSEVYSFTASNLCDVIQDKIYINPLLFYTYKENPFKQETREYPIDYSYPFTDRYAINIQIPEGYVVESVPAPVNMVMQDDLGGFKFLTNVSGNMIQLSVQHQIKVPIVASDYYEMLKEYYQKMIEKENEKIVLKKA